MTLESVRAFFEAKVSRPPTKWQKAFLAIYLVVGLLAAVAEVVYYLKYHTPTYLFLWLSIPYGAIGWWALRDLQNERNCARLMLSALDDGGANLAWVYVDKTTGQRESTSLHYYFTNRKHGEFFADDQTVQELFIFFTRFTTQLSTGYTPELEKQFRRAPQNLKSAPVRGSQIKVTEVSDNPSNGW